MSSEIVPVVGDITCERSTRDTGEYSKDLGWIHPLGIGLTEDIGAFDVLGLRPVEEPAVAVPLIGGNHHMCKNFISPERGHMYVTELYPDPAYLKSLLEDMKEPSVLLIRGCDQLSQSDFHFEKFKTLFVLEISGVSNLTTIPQALAQMTQLKHLNLSHLPIQQLPDHFFSDFLNLESLVLRGCSNLHSLPKFPQIDTLQWLDLSHLPIETFSERFFPCFKNLSVIILRGCSKLRFLPSSMPIRGLQGLDLSHCTALQNLKFMEKHHSTTKMLDLSCTGCHWASELFIDLEFSYLFLREAEVIELKYISLEKLQLLDLSGAHYIRDLDQLKESHQLVALDLSRTGIESIDFISDLNQLRYLILRGCTRLVRLPSMERLTQLEVLDISCCEILGNLPEDLSNLQNLKELNLSGCSRLRELREGTFDHTSYLEKLDLSPTYINHLPSFSNLIHIPAPNLSHTSVEEVPDLSNLHLVNLTGLQTLSSLDLVPPGSGFTGGQISRMENPHPTYRAQGKSSSKPNEILLVSTFFNNSAFDRFKRKFGMLVGLIQNIEENLKPTTSINVAPFHTSSDTLRRHSKSMIADLEYILDKVDVLESSHNCTSGRELLDELLHATDSSLSAFDFRPGSTNLNLLLRTIAKLKLVVPPEQVNILDKTEEGKTNKFLLGKMEGASDSHDIDMDQPLMQQLGHSYDSLTDIQRKCLLYFSAFPPTHRSLPLRIRGRVLIQLWYGEGYIDPKHEGNVSLSNPEEATYSNASLKSMGTRTKESMCTTGLDIPNTVEEIGRKILMALSEKKFINQRMMESVTTYWGMEEYVHSFVRVRAKAEHLFNFNQKNSLLANHLNGSERACLVRSHDNFPSSGKLWVKYANSSTKLKRLEIVRTLFNADEAVVDINAEWFSQMRNLCVLHLGIWEYAHEKHIDAVDLKFLEELKNIKKLRLLSLEGFSTIKKLPESVCELTSLKILNLRGCSDMEELPTCIGSLKSITHLDLTDCHIMSKLPKGLQFLSKLEVLKGFMISYQIGGRQHRNACTLIDLLKLERLRILKLVVNKDTFPDNKDLLVFKEMKNLYNLKITWEKDYNNDQASPGNVVVRKTLRHSRFHKLKCSERQTHQQDTEEPLEKNHLNNLKKLSLYCFPFETAPNWLDPSELRRLEKLSIVGGELKNLVGDTNQNTWNVKTLNLAYLPNYREMCWEKLRLIFPNVSIFNRDKTEYLGTN